jgi:hypothetical protein
MIGAAGDFTAVGGVGQKRYASLLVGAAATSTRSASESGTTVVASFNFDVAGPNGSFADGSGAGHTLQARSSNGGTLQTVAHGPGQAVVFPEACTGTSCPRLVLQAADAPDLNPGSGPISFGANVLLGRSETSDGENILQKGYSTTGGGQYKLQVDGVAGRPSCTMVDQTAPTLYVAKSTVSIADGGWHAVECRRVGTSLTVLVDGVVRGGADLPAALSVVNTTPLSLGGKGLTENNDQFHGALDDVWISID